MLRLGAAMADARVSLNGTEIARHRDGYTPIEARLTPHLRDGENVLKVDIDGSENPAIPPLRRPDRLPDLCRPLPRGRANRHRPGPHRDGQDRNA
jgi:hypothetical protein